MTLRGLRLRRYMTTQINGLAISSETPEDGISFAVKSAESSLGTASVSPTPAGVRDSGTNDSNTDQDRAAIAVELMGKSRKN